MDQHGFKDETKPKFDIVIQAPDYSKPAEEKFLMPDKPAPVDEKLDKRSAAMIERANAFVCKTPEDYKRGDLVVSECAALVKTIKLIHDPICVATNTAHKIATKARKDLIDPINQASKIIDIRLGNYKMEFEKKKAAEQKRLDDIARKEQEDAALNEAAQLEKDGAPKELVDAVLETANEPRQGQKSETPDLSSNNSRTPDWDIEIVDKKLIPVHYVTVNEGAIRTAVRSAKGNIKIPGVKIIDTFKTRRKAL